MRTSLCALLGTVLWLVGPSYARAQGLGLAAQLQSDSPNVRAAAIVRGMSLDEAALDAIDVEITQFSANRPSPEALFSALSRFRNRSGVSNNADDIDLVRGIGPALNDARDATSIAAAMHVLLLRSLEGMGTTPAAERMAKLLNMDPGVWLQEARRIRLRMGYQLAPFFIASQNDARVFVRNWARAGIEQLQLADPSAAITHAEDPRLLADMLLAYSRVHDMNAMRVVGAYLGSPKTLVRNAAREAIRNYGRNAIWVVRDAFTRTTRREPDLDASFESLCTALYAAMDAERTQTTQAALANVNNALAHDDEASAFAVLERNALHNAESLDDESVAALYRRIAAAAETKSNDALAAQAWQRARWWGRDAQGIALAARHELAHEGIALARAGIADLARLEQTQSADMPARLSRVHDAVSGELQAQRQRRRRVAAIGGAIAFAAIAYALRQRRQRSAPPQAAAA